MIVRQRVISLWRAVPISNLSVKWLDDNPDYVQQKIRKILLRKNGWNVDVPITSHYRQGPKRKRGRPKKKHLTGNSYYAAMGKKGGRPRIYNVV